MRVSKGSVSSCQTGDGTFLHFKSSRRVTETDFLVPSMRDVSFTSHGSLPQGTRRRRKLPKQGSAWLTSPRLALPNNRSIILDKITRTHSNSKCIEGSILSVLTVARISVAKMEYDISLSCLSWLRRRAWNKPDASATSDSESGLQTSIARRC